MRTTRLAWAIAALLVGASACSDRAPHASETSRPPAGSAAEQSLLVDGSRRTYRLYVPSSPAGQKQLPLLLALHGGFGSGRQLEQSAGFNQLAEQHGFIVAYPDGTQLALPGDGRVWNGGRCCGIAAQDRQNVDDVSFLTALITHIGAEHPVDVRRVYVTGHSNGGIMAYRIACERSELIAAIAFQAGTLEIEPCRPARPVSVYSLHGADDPSMPLHGGRGERALSRTDFASPVESVKTWAALDGCAPSPTVTIDPANRDVTRSRWTGCRDNTAVEMVVVDGANHAWMGHPGSALVGTPYMELDASREIWTFLASVVRT